MPYITCVVSTCNTRRHPNTLKSDSVKCFSFPKDPAIKQQWLNLCQVQDCEPSCDSSRRVCIRHFKEDDFVDGLKARLLNLQPRVLKKDAVPSLYLPEAENENTKETQMKTRKELFEKFLEDAKKPTRAKKRTQKETNMSNNTSNDYKEYLSNLVPIAPKKPAIAIISQKMPIPALKKPISAPKVLTIAPKVLPLAPQVIPLAPKVIPIAPKELKIEPKELPLAPEELSIPPKELPITPNEEFMGSERPFIQPQETLKCPSIAQNCIIVPQKKNPKGTKVLSKENFEILQLDNAMYKKQIRELLHNQYKLKSKVKELEAKIMVTEKPVITKIKETFAGVFTANQIDVLMGKLRTSWSDMELAKAYHLYRLSKKAYIYVRDTLHYPFPCLSTLGLWANKIGAEIPRNDDEIVAPISKHEQLCLDDIKEISIEDVDAIKEESVENVHDIKEESIKDVDAVKEESIEDVDDIKEESIKDVDAVNEEYVEDVNDIKEESIKDVDAVNEESIEVVDDIKEESIKDVDDIKEESIKDVDAVNEEYVEDVNDIKEESIKDVDDINQESIKDLDAVKEESIEDVGDIKKESIEDVGDVKEDSTENIDITNVTSSTPQEIELNGVNHFEIEPKIEDICKEEGPMDIKKYNTNIEVIIDEIKDEETLNDDIHTVEHHYKDTNTSNDKINYKDQDNYIVDHNYVDEDVTKVTIVVNNINIVENNSALLHEEFVSNKLSEPMIVELNNFEPSITEKDNG